MNARQINFCNGIISGLSATASAEKAGYSKKTAYSIGARLLKNVEIKKFIKTQQAKLLQETKTTVEEVTKRVWQLYYSSKSDAIKLRALELLGKSCHAWLSVSDLLQELSDKQLAEMVNNLILIRNGKQQTGN